MQVDLGTTRTWNLKLSWWSPRVVYTMAECTCHLITKLALERLNTFYVKLFFQIFKSKQTHAALTVKNCGINRDIPIASLFVVEYTGKWLFILQALKELVIGTGISLFMQQGLFLLFKSQAIINPRYREIKNLLYIQLFPVYKQSWATCNPCQLPKTVMKTSLLT